VGTLYLLLGGENAFELISSWSKLNLDKTDQQWYFIAGTAVLVWPFIVGLKTMKEISWVAIFGMSATALTVIIICVCSVLFGNIDGAVHEYYDIQRYPYAFSVFLFAFGGHNVFPAIQESMEHKKDYDKMMNVSFIVTLLLYLPPTIMAYLYFGGNIKSPVLQSFPPDSIWAQVATIAITLHIWLTIPIINNPLNLWIEELLAARFQYSNKYFANGFFSRFVIRTFVLAVETAIACKLPFFGDFMSFIGSSTVAATIFFFPCFFYLKLKWEKIPTLEKVWVFIVLILSTLGAAIGLYTAITGLVNDVMGPEHQAFVLPDWFFFVIIGCIAYISLVVISVAMWKLYQHHIMTY